MLRIRESQLVALAARAAPALTDAQLATGLRDLGWFDPAREEHRRVIGASPDSSPEAIASLLTRFVSAVRRDATGAGIVHEALALEYAGLFFRYSPDWPSREDAAAVLADSTLDQGEKMKRLARVVRIACLRSG